MWKNKLCLTTCPDQDIQFVIVVVTVTIVTVTDEIKVIYLTEGVQ